MSTDLKEQLRQNLQQIVYDWRKSQSQGTYSQKFFAANPAYIRQVAEVLRRDGWSVVVENKSEDRETTCFVITGYHLELETNQLFRRLVSEGGETSYRANHPDWYWEVLKAGLESNGCIVSDTEHVADKGPRCIIHIDPVVYQQVVNAYFPRDKPTAQSMAVEQPVSTDLKEQPVSTNLKEQLRQNLQQIVNDWRDPPVVHNWRNPPVVHGCRKPQHCGRHSQKFFDATSAYISQVVEVLSRDGWFIVVKENSKEGVDADAWSPLPRTPRFIITGHHLELEIEHIFRLLTKQGGGISYDTPHPDSYWKVLKARLESGGCVVSERRRSFAGTHCIIRIDTAIYEQVVDAYFPSGKPAVQPTSTEQPMATDASGDVA